jgi:four helix bundle protein
MAVRDYTELVVWQKAIDLVESVYRLTGRFPKEEIYGLTAQMRRSAVSIPSNIAEGQGRRTTRDFLNFLSIAYGSLHELETQAVIANRLQYLSETDKCGLFEASAETGRLLSGLSNALRKKES